MLEDDHYLLHEGMSEIAEKFNALAGSIRSSKKSSVHQRAADGRIWPALMCFLSACFSILADEEDLIIPLMLEQRQ